MNLDAAARIKVQVATSRQFRCKAFMYVFMRILIELLA